MTALTRTLRLPASAIHKSGHCSVLSALHCQRNRAPYLEPSGHVAKILSLHMHAKHSSFTYSQAQINFYLLATYFMQLPPTPAHNSNMVKIDIKTIKSFLRAQMYPA